MSNLPVDRDKKYMREMWGTTKLITDYEPVAKNVVFDEKSKFIQEIMDYEGANSQKHQLKRQTDLHESIRNDEDYDDWEYGTEPTYGKKW